MLQTVKWDFGCSRKFGAFVVVKFIELLCKLLSRLTTYFRYYHLLEIPFEFEVDELHVSPESKPFDSIIIQHSKIEFVIQISHPELEVASFLLSDNHKSTKKVTAQFRCNLLKNRFSTWNWCRMFVRLRGIVFHVSLSFPLTRYYNEMNNMKQLSIVCVCATINNFTIKKSWSANHFMKSSSWSSKETAILYMENLHGSSDVC